MGRIVYLEKDPGVFNGTGASLGRPAAQNPGVVDAEKAVIQVENHHMATSQLAQTTLRSVLGKHDLDEMLSERAKIINAEGEEQAADRLVTAAKKLVAQPESLQLRYLTTLHDISNDRTTTIVFPFPGPMQNLLFHPALAQGKGE